MIKAPKRPEKDKVIWRYMSLEKYLDFLLTKSIKFTQVSIAADQLEISLMLNRLEKNGSLVGKERILNGTNLHIDRMKKSHYISCWAGKEHECRSLWFSYLGGSHLGVAVKTTVRQFLESVNWDVYGYDYREVVYRDDFEDPEELQINTTLLNAKARAYSSEDEIRFCVSEDLIKLPEGEFSSENPPVTIDPETLPKVIPLELNLESLVNELWISPYCEDWQIDTIGEITCKLAPELRERMKRSDLNEWI
ncbi:hypothetical protein KDX31_10270 [Amphritea atlantica]|uniref:DUF2971 domain-containing protein n=1 Tax=Amphritea atlantica TaxID=355243 RepID=A0ABY5GPW3_9GAMM|nr:hypothetical protein KDX31_10270 [Amphritea atlantica]